MILRQFLHTQPVAISYLFGCGGKACAAVVKPLGDTQTYIEVDVPPLPPRAAELRASNAAWTTS